jgi:hypothetical protein
MNRISPVISVVVIALLIFPACGKTPTGPDASRNPRNYLWTLDTISSGNSQVFLDNIWGSSAQDVYAAGTGGVYHYDGKEWKTVKSSIVGNLAIEDVFGFSPTDIWIVGSRVYPNPNPPPNFLDSCFIAHFDGTQWTEIQELPMQGIMCIWGRSSKEIYAGSEDGNILQYDGLNWTATHLLDSLQIISIGGNASIIFAGGAVTAGGFYPVAMYENRGAGWALFGKQTLSDNYNNPQFGYSTIFSPAPEVIYSSTFGVFKWNGTVWDQVLQSSVAIRGLNGTNPDNVLATGWGPVVYHWNGIDWKNIPAAVKGMPANSVVSGVWAGSDEVFAVGWDGLRSYVIHGK